MSNKWMKCRGNAPHRATSKIRNSNEKELREQHFSTTSRLTSVHMDTSCRTAARRTPLSALSVIAAKALALAALVLWPLAPNALCDSTPATPFLFTDAVFKDFGAVAPSASWDWTNFETADSGSRGFGGAVSTSDYAGGTGRLVFEVTAGKNLEWTGNWAGTDAGHAQAFRGGFLFIDTSIKTTGFPVNTLSKLPPVFYDNDGNIHPLSVLVKNFQENNWKEITPEFFSNTFFIAENSTLTIGKANAENPAHDSIASPFVYETIAKTGAGTQILNADNSYFAGITSVFDGELLLGNLKAKLGGNIIVQSGAVFGGTGTAETSKPTYIEDTDFVDDGSSNSSYIRFVEPFIPGETSVNVLSGGILQVGTEVSNSQRLAIRGALSLHSGATLASGVGGELVVSEELLTLDAGANLAFDLTGATLNKPVFTLQTQHFNGQKLGNGVIYLSNVSSLVAGTYTLIEIVDDPSASIVDPAHACCASEDGVTGASAGTTGLVVVVDGSGSALSFALAKSSDNKKLLLKVSNASSGTSVNSPPVITTPLKEHIPIVAGKSTTLKIKATATGDKNAQKFFYLWEVSYDGGTTWVTAPGANNKPSYTLKTEKGSDRSTGLYRAKITNDAGTTFSTPSHIMVSASPTVTVPPETTKTIPAGESATFHVEASGSAPIQYQWKLNGKNLTPAASQGTSGYNSDTLTATLAGKYTCEIRNNTGKVTSKAGVLKIVVPPTITTAVPTAPLTVVAGKTLKLSVKASGTAKLTYKWFKKGLASDGSDDVPLKGGNKATFSLKTAKNSTEASGTYYVVVENALGVEYAKHWEAQVIVQLPSPAERK
jgi:autotransporter-associated beta strand protein